MSAKKHTGLHQFISDRTNKLSPSGIRKFFDLLASMDDVISLGVGEPDYATPWHISEAAVRSLEKGYTMYTSNSGTLELREETARYLNGQYGVKYDPHGEVLITVGVSEGMDLAMRAILNPGDKVLVPEQYYKIHKEGLAKFKETIKGNAIGKTLELMALRKNGEEFPIELSLSAIKIEGEWNVIGIIRDISERKEAEETLR